MLNLNVTPQQLSEKLLACLALAYDIVINPPSDYWPDAEDEASMILCATLPRGVLDYDVVYTLYIDDSIGAGKLVTERVD